MSLSDFIRKIPDRSFSESAYYCRQWFISQLLSESFSDETIYSRDWDILVILDACRLDLLAEVAADYNWLPNKTEIESGAIDSVAGSSSEWMKRTFDTAPPETLESTAYITGNPFSDQQLSETNFGLLDEMWRYAWDDAAGTIPPDPLIDRGIEVCRTGDYERVILHLMQPHAPFLGEEKIHSGFDPTQWGNAKETNVWHRVRRGELDIERVWNAYSENLRIALESVNRLRQSATGRMVLSADHGNSLGERGIWGHPDIPINGIRRVPWVELEAKDNGQYNPSVHQYKTQSKETVDGRLEALGYK